tara:strand:- start:776 stop:898 length:123 start_codon:yes stop_codon:yes gene_type:complete
MASVRKLKDVIKELKAATKAHGRQAKIIQSHINKFHKNKK